MLCRGESKPTEFEFVLTVLGLWPVEQLVSAVGVVDSGVVVQIERFPQWVVHSLDSQSPVSADAGVQAVHARHNRRCSEGRDLRVNLQRIVALLSPNSTARSDVTLGPLAVFRRRTEE